jgi:hypothetical protein
MCTNILARTIKNLVPSAQEETVGTGIYILDQDNNPVKVDEGIDGLHRWAEWRKDHPKHVAADTIHNVRISTVFLGMDHGFGRTDPVLWETMLFCNADCDDDEKRPCGIEHCDVHLDELDQWCDRYSSHTEALEGHNQWVARVKVIFRPEGYAAYLTGGVRAIDEMIEAERKPQEPHDR